MSTGTYIYGSGDLASALGIVNPRSAVYGATGDGVTDDTTALNAALAAADGGIVMVPPGTYLISAPLVIFSNTLLWALPGAVFNLASGSNCNMLKNAGCTPQRTITDGAMTSASNVLTSAAQAMWTGSDVGRSVAVPGALDGTRPLVAMITGVTSGTQVTLSATAGATVSGTSTAIYSRDSGFEVRGGTWNRGGNGWPTGSSSPNLTTFQIKHADNFSIREFTASCTVRGYQVAVGDVSEFTIRDITLSAPNTVVNTDGINIHGPATLGRIENVQGTTGDDFVSIHSMDGDAGLQDTVGDVRDIVVTNLFPNQNGQAAFKVHAGSTTVCQAITCRGIHGSSLAGGVHIQDYATPTSASIVADILVEDVDCTTSANTGLVNIYCNNPGANITLRDLVWRYNTSFPSVVYVMPGTTLNSLTVDTVTIEAGNNVKAILCGSTSGSPTAMNSITLTNLIEASGGATVLTGVQIDGTFVTCKNIKVRGVQAYKEAGAQQAIVYNKGTVDTIQIEDVYLNGGGIVLGTTSTAATARAVLSNITLESAYQLAQVASTVDMVVNGLNAISITGGPLVFVTGSSAVLTLRGRGLINPNNYAAFTRDLTQTPRIVHREMRIDVALCAVTLGDEAYNTNSASAALGPVTSDGTYWYPVIPKPSSGAIVSGQYSLPDGGQPTSSATFPTGQFRCYPVYIPAGPAIERIWAEVTVVGDGTSVVHLGVYADNGSWQPGALAIDAGTINGASATVQEITLGSPVQLSPGWYWFGGACVFSTTSPTVKTLTASNPVQFPLGSSLPAAGTAATGVYMTGVTAGALPSTFTVAGIAGSCPRIGVKGH